MIPKHIRCEEAIEITHIFFQSDIFQTTMAHYRLSPNAFQSYLKTCTIN